MLAKILFICVVVLLNIYSTALNSKPTQNSKLHSTSKLFEFCKKSNPSMPIRMFKGFLWLPSGVMLNTKRSLKENKVIYSDYCGAYLHYFKEIYDDGITDYIIGDIEIGKIEDCDYCVSDNLEKMKPYYSKLDIVRNSYQDFKSISITSVLKASSMVNEKEEERNTVVLFDDNWYILFFNFESDTVKEIIMLYNSLEKEISSTSAVGWGEE